MENDQKDETSDGCLWKRPSDVMRKIKMRRKRVVSNRSMSTSVAFPAQKEVSGNKKRISNPFAKKRSNSEATSDGKKRILSTNEISSFPELPLWEKDENCQSVFDVAGKLDSKEVLDNNDLGFVFLNEDSIQNMFSPDCFPKLLAPPTKVEKNRTIPADWSLKTKARLRRMSYCQGCKIY
uniref:Uncharacterized protein n=1 Tax=Ciona savignyi TaxID=51511 RepID=H2Z0N3_CIOSA